MSPKKMSGYAQSSSLNSEEDNETDTVQVEQDNHPNAEQTDLETLTALLETGDLTSGVPGSSDDDLADLIARFRDMQLSIEQKIGEVQAEQNTRQQQAKAAAKAKSKAMLRQQKDTQLEAVRSSTVLVLVITPDGRRLRLRIARGKTLGSLRTTILKRCHKMGMFGNVSTDARSRSKPMTRRDIAIVSNNGVNLTSRERPFLYKTPYFQDEECVVGIMYLTQFNAGTFPQNIQMPNVPEENAPEELPEEVVSDDEDVIEEMDDEVDEQ